jgi:ATP-dependent exoDNAse (exonuclease V) beta subunit
MLHVYKASAGSGKTYTLTRFYLKICFEHPEDPAYFRHILTMTFTNAATAEMKLRILKELKLLAFDPDRAEHLTYLVEETGRSEAQIGSLAEQILRAMMEYYSSFAVTTIDSFFQTVLRLFTRELDIKAGYQVELNTDAVLDKAVDAFLDDIESGSPGMYWIEAVLNKRWEAGKSNSFRRELGALGKELFAEGIYEKLAHVPVDALSDIRTQIIKRKNELEQGHQSILERARAVLTKHNLAPDSFSRKSKSKAQSWLVTHTDIDRVVNKYDHVLRILAEGLNDESKWITKKMKGRERQQLLAAFEDLQPLLEETIDFMLNRLPVYQAFKSMSDNIESFAFLSLLDTYVQQYCDENQRVLISETTELLRKVIDYQMLPFFYERLGERYDHILLDEFQDTSTSQWENLEVLVENAVAQAGGSALIVGDVKQAIYRWRNGEWSILQFELKNTYEPEGKYNEKNLGNNWRSSAEIVHFNNQLYSTLPQSIAAAYQEEYQFEAEDGLLRPDILEQVYEGASQEIHEAIREKRRGGYVYLDFFMKGINAAKDKYDVAKDIEKAEQEEAMFGQLRTTIAQVLERGFRRRDICILVRKGSESAEVARRLLDWQGEEGGDRFKFASPEVVRLDQSFSVQLLMAFFRLMRSPRDQVAMAEWRQAQAYLEGETDPSEAVPPGPEDLNALLEQAHSQSLWEIAEAIIQSYELGAQSGEIPFLQEFQDQLLDFSASEGGHVREWLQYWEDQRIFATSVLLPEQQDAIRLMTIHKSKGKEFPIVILPYANWGLNSLQEGGNKTTTLWIDDIDLEGLQLPTFPVNFDKRLWVSSLQHAFQKELIEQLLDALNLLYVATTRAKNELYLFAMEIHPTDMRTVGDALFRSRIIQDAMGSVPSDPELGRFTHRLGAPVHLEDAVQSDLQPKSLQTYPAGTRLPSLSARLSRTDLAEEELSPLSRGSLLHGIMEQVFSEADLNKNLTRAVESGQISRAEEADLRADLLALIRDPKMGPLLQKKSNYLAERAILLPDGTMQRPDRVLIDDEQVWVIDFKSGKKYAAHQKQVQSYMHTLQEMQELPVKGYLIYMDQQELVPVQAQLNV